MTESNRDDAHWLLRLQAEEWIDAARRELVLADAPGAHRRRVITHLRRAAGMGLNGYLVARYDDASTSIDQLARVWGRSYMDHLRALSDDAPLFDLPTSARGRAKALRSLQFQASAGGLVSIRNTAGDDLDAGRDAARFLVDACADRTLRGRHRE